MAQQVEDAFTAEGLDGFAYGLLCRDELTDASGVPTGETRYGLRYDQVTLWREAALTHLVTSLGERVAALESGPKARHGRDEVKPSRAGQAR
jgi:hypothetical protein